VFGWPFGRAFGERQAESEAAARFDRDHGKQRQQIVQPLWRTRRPSRPAIRPSVGASFRVRRL
jgi:hypothetical protein